MVHGKRGNNQTPIFLPGHLGHERQYSVLFFIIIIISAFCCLMLNIGLTFFLNFIWTFYLKSATTNLTQILLGWVGDSAFANAYFTFNNISILRLIELSIILSSLIMGKAWSSTWDPENSDGYFDGYIGWVKMKNFRDWWLGATQYTQKNLKCLNLNEMPGNCSLNFKISPQQF